MLSQLLQRPMPSALNIGKRAFLKQGSAILALAALSGSLCLQPAIAADDVVPPDQLIQRLSTELFSDIKSDKDLRAGNVKRLNELVDAKLMPHVNFQRTTALAVARGWRQATPAQQQQLMDEFRTLLLRTYAGALSAVKDQSVQLKPTRGDYKVDNEVVVRSQVVTPGREPVQLDYRMEKQATGWKVYDVNVMGVWLAETYRNQFAQELSAGGVDGLIKSLVDKNKAAAKASNAG